MNEISIIDKELEDDIFNLAVKENLFNQIEKEIEYIDETIEYKGLLESNGSYEKMPMILSEDDIYIAICLNSKIHIILYLYAVHLDLVSLH